MLPHSVDYLPPVPPLRELPASKAPWRLDSSRAAVLVHDLQGYFLRPFCPDSPALRGMVSSVARVLAAARSAGVPVLYTAQNGDHTHRGLQADLWGPGMVASAENIAIAREVAPAPGEVVLDKWRYSAFVRTDLASRLRSQGRDQLILTGQYAHIGVTATALDAFQQEVQPFLVADAVAAFTADQHAGALDLIAAACGVVLTSDATVERLRAREPDALGSWPEQVHSALSRIVAPEIAGAGFAAPESDLFELGLDSLRAFELLDELADVGVDIDFMAFTRQPTVTFLLAQSEISATR